MSKKVVTSQALIDFSVTLRLVVTLTWLLCVWLH